LKAAEKLPLNVDLRRARLHSLLKNSALHPSEGAGGFSLPNNAPKISVALQAAEKLDKSAIHGTVLKGHDFNRAINTLK
jgi:hypothetical protein